MIHTLVQSMIAYLCVLNLFNWLRFKVYRSHCYVKAILKLKIIIRIYSLVILWNTRPKLLKKKKSSEIRCYNSSLPHQKFEICDCNCVINSVRVFSMIAMFHHWLLLCCPTTIRVYSPRLLKSLSPKYQKEFITRVKKKKKKKEFPLKSCQKPNP